MMKQMTDMRSGRDRSAIYQIVVRGPLDDGWSEWFDDLTITATAEGNTLIAGRVIDQPALHGMLKQVRDLGLDLLSVRRMNHA